MSITVKDILGLSSLNNATLISGKHGLEKEVRRVNFTDSPLDDVDPGYQLVAQGDLYIHSFYDNSQEKTPQIMQLLQFYINSGSACCIGVEYHSTPFSPEVIALAEANDYPIIMIYADVPFGKLIQEISELILTEQIDIHCEDKINRILFEHISNREQTELLQFLLPNVPQKFVCVNIRYPELNQQRFKGLKNDVWRKFKLNLLRHNKGAFFFLDKEIYTIPVQNMKSLLTAFEYYGTDFHIGVSSVGCKNDDVAQYFKEAYYSRKIGQLSNEKVSYYDDVSIYLLLLSVQNTDLLKTYSDKLLTPLREYSERQSVDMIETVKVFIAADGDYKAAATKLNTHINTIRFRIQKAQNLVGLEGGLFSFIEQISVAFKVESLFEQFNYKL